MIGIADQGWSLANVAAEFETVGARQHHIEQEQRGHFAHSFGENGGAADETLHLEAGRPQIMRDQAGNVLVIFDHKNNWTGRVRQR